MSNLSIRIGAEHLFGGDIDHRRAAARGSCAD